MGGNHEEALRYFLRIGSDFFPPVDDLCLDAVMGNEVQVTPAPSPFRFVLPFIDDAHLLGAATASEESVVALFQLVGAEAAGDFLVGHCSRFVAEEGGGGSIQRLYEALTDRPKLLLFVLDLVFRSNNALYTKPTSNSKFAFSVHERHLQLLIEECSALVRAGKQRWTVPSLGGGSSRRSWLSCSSCSSSRASACARTTPGCCWGRRGCRGS